MGLWRILLLFTRSAWFTFCPLNVIKCVDVAEFGMVIINVNIFMLIFVLCYMYKYTFFFKFGMSLQLMI